MRVAFLLLITLFIQEFCSAQSPKDITTYLPAKHVKNGSVDYTEYLQKGLDQNREVYLPNFPVLINHKGLNIESNSKLYFQKNSKLILKPSNTRSYSMLNIDSKENIEIFNALLVGERQEVFDGKKRTGEWGMGISIRSSKNITVIEPVIEQTWGDGIYVGRSNIHEPFTNTDITIMKPTITSARRNGISITTGKNVLIDGGSISRTKGTSPQAGIDIEPNSVKDTIENIRVLNLTTSDSFYGFLISLKGLVSSNNRKATIHIENHHDIGSDIAFRFAGFNRKMEASFIPLNGLVLIKNSIWENNKQPFAFEKTHNLFPKTMLDGITHVSTKQNVRKFDKIKYFNKLKGYLKTEKKFDMKSN